MAFFHRTSDRDLDTGEVCYPNRGNRHQRDAEYFGLLAPPDKLGIVKVIRTQATAILIVFIKVKADHLAEGLTSR
jgi:hypothetical protein